MWLCCIEKEERREAVESVKKQPRDSHGLEKRQKPVVTQSFPPSAFHCSPHLSISQTLQTDGRFMVSRKEKNYTLHTDQASCPPGFSICVQVSFLAQSKKDCVTFRLHFVPACGRHAEEQQKKQPIASCQTNRIIAFLVPAITHYPSLSPHPTKQAIVSASQFYTHSGRCERDAG